MGKPVRGDVVVIPFPFSDLSGSKRRPALVVAELDGDDLILCMITGREIGDKYAVSLDSTDFQSGSLPVSSNIRPSRLFTSDSALVSKTVGQITQAKRLEVASKLASLFSLDTAAGND